MLFKNKNSTRYIVKLSIILIYTKYYGGRLRKNPVSFFTFAIVSKLTVSSSEQHNAQHKLTRFFLHHNSIKNIV